ncbi:MAG: type II and III secretion system protein family protein [Proteobacteria bacterium]|nr:type II and III secretion system protein family protein [Pseudomonadota bacterium]MBU4447360.1 type II and III secretion system protein family protein [Pseudomonadota bacterium]
MKKPAQRWMWLWWGIILVLLGAVPAQAADLLDRVRNQEINQVLRLKVGRSKVLRTPFALTRISVADPDIADLILISEREIYINALAPGATNISMWGKSRFTSATVTVEADLTLLKEKLHQILPKEKIGAEAAGDSIVLTGEVSGPVAQSTALALALPYAGGKKDKVVNLLHVGGVQQVMLEVRVAEINRLVAERMGVNFNALAPQGNFGVQQINSLASVDDLFRVFTGAGSASTTSFTQLLAPALTAMGGWTAAGTLWTVFLDLLKQQNLGRVLAEPNLVTTSGQQASFLAGGEFPVPVPQASGGGTTITVEYKKFGVQLEFTPTVLNDSKIAVKVHPTVSELDNTFGQSFVLPGGYVVPGLRTREMNTQVEVNDGQTFAIAGLLSDNSRTILRKFPVLGDIPILGALFRSNEYQKNLTELVALVTPRLVKPMAPGAARLPTDKWIDPSDVDFYLLGLDQGRQKPAPGPAPAPAAPLPPKFGHQSLN